MGITNQYECDRCGLQVLLKYYFPDGWRYLKIQRYERAIYHDEDYWLLCKGCVKFIKGILPKCKVLKF